MLVHVEGNTHTEANDSFNLDRKRRKRHHCQADVAEGDGVGAAKSGGCGLTPHWSRPRSARAHQRLHVFVERLVFRLLLQTRAAAASIRLLASAYQADEPDHRSGKQACLRAGGSSAAPLGGHQAL